MTTLYTVAYPILKASDRESIDAFRKQHDERQNRVIAPHFTLVFACSAVGESEYFYHIQSVAEKTSEIPFRCRYAMLGADDQDETAYVFLVPDEGYSQISRLHDRLYGGPLASHLRLGLPYIPHITIGTLNSRIKAKALCDNLNAQGLEIEGLIRTISVGSVQAGVFKDLATFELQA